VDRYNALALIRPAEAAPALTLPFTVRPAPGLRGTVVGPGGEPVAGAVVVGLTSMPDAERLESASFTVEGLNPGRPRTLSFHQREMGLGKVVTVRGGEPGPVCVRLEPCGEVTGRVVDRAGIPARRITVYFLRDDNGVPLSTRTDREGRFRMGLVAGQPYALSSFCRLSGRVGVQVRSGLVEDLGDVTLGR
jgi:hypothetical protein